MGKRLRKANGKGERNPGQIDGRKQMAGAFKMAGVVCPSLTAGMRVRVCALGEAEPQRLPLACLLLASGIMTEVCSRAPYGLAGGVDHFAGSRRYCSDDWIPTCLVGELAAALTK